MKDPLIGAAPVRRLLIGRVGLVAGFALVGAVAIVLLNEAVSPVEDLSLVRVAHPVQMLVPAPPSLQGLREWYVDSEIQGECECERPYDAVTHVANPEIVCKCPRSYVPTAVELADYDEEEQSEEDPEEMEYEDGCDPAFESSSVAAMQLLSVLS
jgi:hypothetical protein